MSIKILNDILREIMNEGKKTPGEWKVISASTRDRTGSDFLLFNPTSGPIYQIKAYEQNPYKMEGYGARISRNVDEDFLKLINNKKQGNIGILDLNFRIIQESLNEGNKLDKIFLDALLGKKDQGIDFLNLGESYKKNKDPIPTLTETQRKLNEKYEKLVKKDGKSSIYG